MSSRREIALVCLHALAVREDLVDAETGRIDPQWFARAAFKLADAFEQEGKKHDHERQKA
ncbi:MAG: hypothetical protein CMF70_06885 [Magnetovibrio sp.]|nr:hypothetical protein [Magnetovibrio sp.]|tara:strand:- start:1936 stop:2115 length:180 start_codon:yes stop_codon:yes gene_type:complete